MKKKNKLLPIISISSVLLITLTISVINSKHQTYEEMTKKGNAIAMYIEGEDGEYTQSQDNKFPTEGYVLDTEQTNCKNGGIITQNAKTKKLKLVVKDRDECEVYFKKEKASSAATLAKMNITPKTGNPDFTKIAPEIASYTDNNFTGTTSNRTMSTTYQGRYYTYADTYTFDTSTGTYTLTNPQVCKYSECYETLKGKYIVSTTGSTSTTAAATSKNLTNIYKVTTDTTLSKMYYITSTKTENYDLSKDGVYSMEDDYGTSYYYRGAVESNYVRFGKNKDGQDMYWRIIRINGNGTLRVIYDGTSAYANGDNSEDRVVGYSIWNDNYDDAKYVGYMYSPANEVDGTTTPSTSKEQAQTNTASSTMKEYLNAWYQENIIATGYNSYVSDTLFCNDRSTSDLGYGGEENTIYNAHNRISSGSPQLKCPKNDAFIVSDEIGNKALSTANPIGLITSDEVILGGGQWAENNKYYLYKESKYWTFSPAVFGDYAARMSIVHIDGYLSTGLVDDGGAVAPVINLSTDFVEAMTGDGTMINPYHL